MTNGAQGFDCDSFELFNKRLQVFWLHRRFAQYQPALVQQLSEILSSRLQEP